MATEAQNLSREMILRAYKAPLHLSRALYKSTLFMQNKPNTKPIQSQSNPIQTQFLQRPKWTQTLFHKRIMKMKPPSGPKKTNPIQTQFIPTEGGSNPTCSELACPELVEGVEPIFKNSAPFLTGVDKSCQIMDNEAGIVHSPKLGRKIDAFACKTKWWYY